MAKVVLCETMLRPSVIEVPASSGDGKTYSVVSSTLFNDSFCTCPGFQFRGDCKHVKMITNARCTYHEPANLESTKQWYLDQLRPCPACGSNLVLFDMEPEFD